MGQRALVTGASSGIGEATVRLLVEEGWEVLATARRGEDLERLDSWGCTPIEVDLRDLDAVRSVAEEVVSQGPLHGLVHNAGVGLRGALEDLGPEAWRHQFEVDVFGAMELTRGVLPAVREAQGRIVFISSQAALVSMPLYGAFCASKMAVEAAADALRMELLPENIAVAIVEPALVATPFHDRAELRRENYVDDEETRRGPEYERMDRALAEQVRGKVAPEAVASAVHKALTQRWVRARYRVGKGSWLAVRLLRLLPTRIRDRVVRYRLGL